MKGHLRQFVRFGAVGVVNTGIYYVFYLPLRLVMAYVLAHVIAWVVSTYGSFLLNCRFTYHVRPTLRRALIYPVSNVPNLLATTLGVVALVEVGGLSQKWAPLVAGILAIPLTFVIQRGLMLSPWAERPLARAMEQGNDVLVDDPARPAAWP